MAPVDEYGARLAGRRATAARLDTADARLSYARLVVFAAGTVMAVVAWRGGMTWWAVLAPLVAFIVLVVRHDRVLRQKQNNGRAIGFYERGLARIEDRWSGTGEAGDRFRSDDHLYANDLDLFGRGSLFELLSVARTRAGEEKLADWLNTPAAADEVGRRQDALRELAPALDLREMLAVAGDTLRAGVNTEALLAWAAAPPILKPLWLRPVAVVLTAGMVATIVWTGITGDWLPLEIAVGVQLVAAWLQRHAVDHALHAADAAARDLHVLRDLLQTLERQTFTSPRLAGLHRQLAPDTVAASVAIGRLRRLIEMHDWQHNAMFAPVALVLLWGTHLAWAVEAWRARHGEDVRRWLDAVAEIEALSSLAAYHYEHPADPFPEILDTTRATFDGTALGHPLLASAKMVRNDVHLSGDTRLLVVSGSNMSGKSTLLRTVGINAVLALAGAPVRAAALRLSPLTIGATLRIQDSLQEGRSRFYAEITRIRQLADRARGVPPLLFLLDELFHGTNSHDRLVGASGVLGGFLDHGAIGLITTHDLALTAVADQLAPRAINVHFEDWFDGGDLRFDYLMKPGPVTRSNAIALMRAVGLDVADAGTPS